MTAVAWTATEGAPKNVDSPLAKLVQGMPIDDEGVKRTTVIYDGNTVTTEFPMSDVLNKIATSKDKFTKQVDGKPVEITKAEAQANATIRELYRAAGQLTPKAFVRAKKSVLVDGRVAVSAYRASKGSTRGRGSQNNRNAKAENGEG